ncbi:hypothetical protein [Mucilaginibacter lappiensis]|uniref:Erythromycin esterase n=1 Tax=Mucilaginibacter lappiensis TaxID=354630 RepID=A0A841JGQ8_9SPHI|nr:hypothetical protein [Mucilaginibacter lappiensis]MBB6129492.1 hypothetical protein [Mucilaginibacter lappiensis]
MKIRFAMTWALCFLLYSSSFAANISKKQVLPKTDTTQLESLTHKLSFVFEKGNFTGIGWDSLIKETQKAHFLLIGEQHGEAEIPVFTGKLALVFKPKALVVEVDPYTASQLKKVAINPAGYLAYFKQNPYAFAFYSWQTELDLARQMQLNNIDIWGLNEINFLSLGRFFNMLGNNAKIPKNKSTAFALEKKYEMQDQPIFKDANKYNDFSAYKLKAATIDSLLQDFSKESYLSRKMLLDLKASIPVYTNEFYQPRVNIMKGELVNYVSPYIKQDVSDMPKLLFKFGADHVTRTNDLTRFFEVGSLADNLVEAVGKKSLHILIFGKKGTINEMAPVDNNVAIKAYDVLGDRDLAMFSPLTNLVNSDEWGLFDLRPVRNALKSGSFHTDNKKLYGYIMGFDFVVIPGYVTGSRFIE